METTFFLTVFLSFVSVQFAFATQDLVIADFESDSYGQWKTTGTAFGDAPAAGTLPGQMQVSGFSGKKLANSFHGGDDSIGTLTSPTFTIQRNYIHFLIGGGGYKDETCMTLIVDGQVVRQATGTNIVSGGSERLAADAWDVRELSGKQATIQLIDNRRAGWGHINVDQIVQSDSKPALVAIEKTFTVDRKFLLIPIKNGVPKVDLDVHVNGELVRHYHTELATNPNDVDWYAYFTIDTYRGKSAVVSASRASESTFELIRQADRVPASEQNYDEPLRPQFHFSQLVGWNNDPNGMVYLDGEWHLYFQHNPVGWGWGNMTWGHAVSKDLIHWQQLANVFFPGVDAKGASFSGGAVIDKQNTSGWKTGDNDVLVAFLTDTGAGEAVAYSNDRGRSFTWYKGNPIIKHKGRDPKVVWYAYDGADAPISDLAKQLGGHWAMVVYDESEENSQNTDFYTSTNLKDWTKQSSLTGYYECPELFELAIEGSQGQSRWVTFAADGKYTIGTFDGKTFTPQHTEKQQLHYGKFYASQTFDNAPDGRRIQIAWMRIPMEGMPFNQTFTFPHQLTLRQSSDGIRMFATPVKEIETLYHHSQTIHNKTIQSGRPLSVPVSGELFDIEATFKLGDATTVGIDIGGNRIPYSVADQKWMIAPTPPIDNRVTVRVLLDRSQLEVWGNGGAVTISEERQIRGDVHQITAFAEGGEATLLELKVHELKPIVPRRD